MTLGRAACPRWTVAWRITPGDSGPPVRRRQWPSRSPPPKSLLRPAAPPPVATLLPVTCNQPWPPAQRTETAVGTGTPPPRPWGAGPGRQAPVEMGSHETLHGALRNTADPHCRARPSLPFGVGTGLSCPSSCPNASLGSGPSESPAREHSTGVNELSFRGVCFTSRRTQSHSSEAALRAEPTARHGDSRGLCGITFGAGATGVSRASQPRTNETLRGGRRSECGTQP